jgi:hypothetical protein
VSPFRIAFHLAVLLLPLLLVAGAASAQVVEGRVVEDASGDAIAAADLLVTDDRASPVARAITDAEGRFRVPLPAPGRYRITATRIGFAPWAPEAFEVRTGDTVRIEIRLRAAPVALDTVTVVRRARPVHGEANLRGAIARRTQFPRVGSRRVALSSDPEFRGATRVTDVLRRLTAGGGDCTIVHWDGRVLPGFVGEARLEGFADDYLAIEAYRRWHDAPIGLRDVPADVADPSRCSVVALWPR